jgi:hypothetical protein
VRSSRHCQTSRVRSSRVRSIVAITSLAFVGACTSATATTPVVPRIYDLSADPAAQIAEVDPDRGAVVPASELRLLLDGLMEWHGIALVQVMRTAQSNDDGVDVWLGELDRNTVELTNAVGLVYGPVGARAFNQQWAQHMQFLIDYASGVGRGDDDAIDLARAQLRDYTRDNGSFFATATAGRLPSEAVTELLDTHVGHMIEQLDAFSTGDTPQSSALSIRDHQYLYGIAGALAGALADQQPQAFPGQTASEQTEFCSLVTRSLSAYGIATVEPSTAVRSPASESVAVATSTSTWNHLVVAIDAFDGTNRDLVDMAAIEFVDAVAKDGSASNQSEIGVELSSSLIELAAAQQQHDAQLIATALRRYVAVSRSLGRLAAGFDA